MSIQSVALRNFRGFKEHTATFSDLSVFVGLNNAGKSTLIDALRLLAVAVQRSSKAKFTQEPSWVRHESRGAGFSTTFSQVEFDFANLGYNLDEDEITRVGIRFKNKSQLVIWIDPVSRANFIQIFDKAGELVLDRAGVGRAEFTPIYVMPPIQRVLANEKVLNPDTVKGSAYGRLAYRHFRNQLASDHPSYQVWSKLLEETWPGLRVRALDTNTGEGEDEIRLTLADPPFVSEVAWVGSGLQSWMQLIWFLSRTPKDSSIVLDEPDAYLHADLQRKLIKIVAETGFLQVSVATHSAEIISDVDPSSIIVVKKKNRHSQKAVKSGGAQKVIDNLGSRHNVQLSKLSEAKRVLIYEGDDQKYLSQIALKLGGNFYNRFMLVPYFDIAGVQNWHEAVGAAKALAAATSGQVAAHLIIDRDFRSEENVTAIRDIAVSAGLKFHCWSKKEIENYFINPSILAKYASRGSGKIMSIEAARQIIDDCAAQLEEDAVLAINNDHYNGKDIDAARAHYLSIRGARPINDVIGGKRLISRVSSVLKADWGCQANATNLCRFSVIEDIDQEIIALVRELSSFHAS